LDGTGSTYEKVRKNGSYKKAIEGIKKLTDGGVVTDISFIPSHVLPYQTLIMLLTLQKNYMLIYYICHF
jgi:hypothetical protein